MRGDDFPQTLALLPQLVDQQRGVRVRAVAGATAVLPGCALQDPQVARAPNSGEQRLGASEQAGWGMGRIAGGVPGAGEIREGQVAARTEPLEPPDGTVQLHLRGACVARLRELDPGLE